ncbi:MAG: sigma-54-dependent Fis family transcriptional regulator [Archangium gephyra]|uniref:Sigma-54-dependent Fis family transcriptional regulator n=1 Tax=Archangium gephyra TaxID=48 RepID=A0A2W5T059_9BACT|nr:MAG: sigma-54-dependent Fis family transcriptional regulator [Archangium gephyra]
MKRLLIIDDDPSVVLLLTESLRDEGYDVTGETSAPRALELLQARSFDLVISDIEMPELRGLELLRSITRTRPEQMVLLITAFGSIDLAMESVRAGAIDFLAKPFRIEALVLAVERALRERMLRREVVRLREAATREAPHGLAARSPAMQQALDLATRAARSQLPVLITGESGVGKGALARFIHDSSGHAGGRFVQLNCAALPTGLAEAELFGVRRGAFTDAREDRPGVFEQAHKGTLFLDEIGELPAELQPKLLQALESNTVRPLGAANDVAAEARIIAATNRPLEDALRDRRFRADLYHRLNVVRLEVPPLRSRFEDIDLIVDQVLQRVAARSGRTLLGVSADGMRWLRSQRWPCNVRELINTLERAAALTDHDVLSLADLAHEPVRTSDSVLDAALRSDLTLDELERAYIRQVLEKTGGHKGNAARVLGLDRRTLYKKVAELKERE